MFGISHLGRHSEYSGLFPGWTAAPKKTEWMQTSFWLHPHPPPQVAQLPEIGICKIAKAPIAGPAPQKTCNLPLHPHRGYVPGKFHMYQKCFVLSENWHEDTRLRLLLARFFLHACLAGYSVK